MRYVVTACLLLLPVSLLEAATGDELVKLEPFIIEASVEGPWHYLAVPGFEIISRCPDDFTSAYARALQNATATRLALLPENFWGELPTPIEVVLYNRKPKQSEDLIQTNRIDLSWSPQSEAILGSKSVRVTFPKMVGDGDVFVSCGNYWNVRSASNGLCLDLDSVIRLRSRVPQFPSWFVVGLEGPHGLFANRFNQSTSEGDFVILPNALWISESDTIALQKDFKRRLEGKRVRDLPQLLSLAKLFNGDIGKEQQALWNSEAALFMRWGLYGKRKGGADYRAAMLAFADQATKEPVSETMFQKYFGLNYAEAEQSLREFLVSAVVESIQVPVSVPKANSNEIREATALTSARIIGDWARLEARKQGPLYFEYRRKCLEQADRVFERKYAGREQDSLFLATLGLYAAQIGDDGRARKALEVAIGAGVVRPAAYVELARLRLKDALPSTMHGIGDLDSQEFGDILALLAKARAQMPALPSSYRVLLRALRHGPTKLGREDFKVLREALNLFPYDVDLVRGVADLYKTSGFPEESIAIIERALQFSDSAEARIRLAGLPDGQSK